ncbi:ACT domain-containing protein [Niabella sp. 22666]|uniref:ACT domain-containing protein n=1 Tax=Niabella sp. 22666 TaxID=3453954 RepID=UPI003F8328C8
MSGETNLEKLLKTMTPQLNAGSYVFCTVPEQSQVDFSKVILFFREREGITLILRKDIADDLQLNYSFIASWITLAVHSSLEAVGLTAAFSMALTQENISCNVVAGYYHDHIFVDTKDAQKAMNVLHSFSNT